MEHFVDYFHKVLRKQYTNIHLYIITTERESVEYPTSTTIQYANRFSKASNYVMHLHYPNIESVMAHQLNFAVKKVAEGDVFAIYNVDSRPEPATFEYVAGKFKNSKDTSALVFQQYGLYPKNIRSLEAGKNKSILIANAYWQNRWSIGFELYRAVKGVERRTLPSIFQPFNYCIGHGLFVPRALVGEISFRENTINEDAVFGLELCALGKEIVPVPYFDIADSPDSVYSLYKQKANWFQGPFQAFTYLKRINPLHITNTVRLGAIKLYSHAIYWLFGPLFMYMIIIGIITSLIGLSFTVSIIGIVSIFSFILLPTFYVGWIINVLQIKEFERIDLHDSVKYIFLGAIIAYGIHGVSAIRGIYISRRLDNNLLLKSKTAMKKKGSN